jgi:hypothetical protein
MNKNVLIDEAARQAIIRELDSCFLVEAGQVQEKPAVWYSV